MKKISVLKLDVNSLTQTSVSKGKKQIYKFIKDHCTSKVKIYDYEPFKKEKKLLVEVDIQDIAKNNYSLNYNEYIEEDNKNIKYVNHKLSIVYVKNLHKYVSSL